MKNLKFLTLAIAILGFTATSFAQNPTAVSSAMSTATILTPISIVKVATMDLRFGNIIASAAGGSVTIGTDGVAAYSGVTKPTATPGTAGQAQFTVSGLENATYAITLPASVSLSNGTQTMTVDNIVSDPSGTGTIASGGTQTINVGGKLNVGSEQAPGTYTNAADLTVTVAYN